MALSRILIIFLSLFILGSFCRAQDEPADSERVPAKDSLTITPNFKTQDEILKETSVETQGFRMQKSPTGAIARSLIIPGWGQFYVEEYWKTPIFLGAAGVLGWFIYDNHVKFTDAKDLVESTSEDDPYYDIYKADREFFRDSRDQSAFYLLAVYAISAVDAYVNAHLYDFDVSDENVESASLDLRISPSKFGGGQIGLYLRF